MDAKTVVSHQISRLQDLLSEVDTNNNPTFVKEVVTAIQDLHSLEQSLQSLQLSELQTKVSCVIKAVYSAEDITDSLIVRKEFHPTRKRENNGFINTFLRRQEYQPTRKRKNNGSKKKFQRLLTYFKSSPSQDQFALELEKFRNEITALSTREDFFGSSNHTTSSFQNEEGQQSRHQRWENFPDHCLEEETNVVVKQQIKGLVARLFPETNCNADLSGTHDHSSEVLLIVWLRRLLSNKEPTDCSSEITANENSEHVLGLLNYQDLPSQVKPCFLYIGLFQKGNDIPARRLIHLWCAEGFVTPSTIEEMVPKDLAEKMVPEDMAELYLLMLVNRNMIQVTRWMLDGSPKTCRMHDHLHDIFSQRAEEVGFFYHDQFQNSHAEVKQPQFPVRRLAAAYLGNNSFLSSSLDLRYLYSCVVFDTREGRNTPASDICGFLNKIIVTRDFGLLKVLDLEGVYKPTLSDAIVEKLLQLRYLGLRSTFIDLLPSFVGFLPYLDTLDLKHTEIRKLPSSIWKAKKLQHLYLDWNHSEIVSTSSFTKSLSNLRTLWGIYINDDCNGKLNFQRSFSRLRKLGLSCLSTSAFKIMTQLTQLQTLKVKYVEEDGRRSNFTSQMSQLQQWTELEQSAARVRWRSREKTYGLHLQLQSMKKLQNAYLMGKLEKQVINVDFLPPTIRILTLSESRLEDDPMPVLEKLPHLKILRLFADSYVGEKLKCSLHGFPELDVLKLRKLPGVKEWTVEEGAMPSLRKLEIRECYQLQVPRELQHYFPTECN